MGAELCFTPAASRTIRTGGITGDRVGRTQKCTGLAFISPKQGNKLIHTTQCNALEESKRRARSPYDNIPDWSEQYRREISAAERKYGRRLVAPDSASVASAAPTSTRDASDAACTAPTPDASPERPGDLGTYERLRARLMGDTAMVGGLGACAGWAFGTVHTAQSFLLGALASLGYVFLLSRSVDRLAESARASGMAQGDSLQPARVALLAIVFIGAAKRRESLEVFPVLLGFFSYKVAALVPLVTGEAFED